MTSSIVAASYLNNHNLIVNTDIMLSHYDRRTRALRDGFLTPGL